MTRSVPALRRSVVALVSLWLGLPGLLSSASAADIQVVKTPTGEAVVNVSGVIDPGDEAKMASALSGNPHPKSVSLSSLGGNVQAALAIGSLVRHEGLKTLVPARTICASACGLVWLAGTPRAMGENAHVGLHAAYLRKNGVAVETGAANALIGAYLDRLGFDDHAIVYLTGASPDEMTWILAADRQRYGIAFESGPPQASLAALALPSDEHRFLQRPLAFAGAMASAAVGVVNRLLGRNAAAAP